MRDVKGTISDVFAYLQMELMSVVLGCEPILDQCFYFIPRKSTRKSVFLVFPGGYKMETVAKNGLMYISETFAS